MTGCSVGPPPKDFATEDAVLAMRVESHSRPVFDAIAPGLHLLVNQLEVLRPSGDRYSAESVPGYVRIDFDEWQVDYSV